MANEVVPPGLLTAFRNAVELMEIVSSVADELSLGADQLDACEALSDDFSNWLLPALAELRESLLKPVRDACHSANPYPAIFEDWYAASYVEVVERVGIDLYGSVIDVAGRDTRNVLRPLYRWPTFGPISEWPSIPAAGMLENHDKVHKVAERFSRSQSSLLYLHLVKEFTRVSGHGPPEHDGTYGNEARDCWMYEQRAKGVTIANVRSRLAVDHPEWEQLETDQGVTIACRRYAGRKSLPWPISRNST